MEDRDSSLLESLGPILALVSVVISLASVIFAYRSNAIAQDAVRQAEQANALAAESNQLVLPDLSGQIGFWTSVVWMGCYNNQSGNPAGAYELHTIAAVDTTFVNSGGRAVSLVDARFMDASGPQAEAFTAGGELLAMPLDLDAGMSRTPIFVAEAVESFDSPAALEARVAELAGTPGLAGVDWLFTFGGEPQLVMRSHSDLTQLGERDAYKKNNCARADELVRDEIVARYFTTP